MSAQSLGLKPAFFQAAATIAFVSASHHIHRGRSELYPAWSKLPAASCRAACTGWDYMSISYAITILLNLKWARHGGPTDLEEQAMLLGFIVGGGIEGWRCIRNGEFLPLVAFWGIPIISLIATFI
ncbi:Uncharacterized protein HZ326_27164 [Fusarium oxysporum f. sp. albedinis]|nr:Uncharacterized protein HZ326_27164 [Fusarium oxysporum f. sp. albedinis]